MKESQCVWVGEGEKMAQDEAKEVVREHSCRALWAILGVEVEVDLFILCTERLLDFKQENDRIWFWF